jgi:hypothetical protein
LGADTQWQALGDHFVGSAVISSNTNIVVTSLVDITTSEKGVYAFEGVPVEMAQSTLYVPLFRAEQRGRSGDPTSSRLDTGISVMNPNESSVDVSLTYYGAGGSCVDQVVTTPAMAIPARSAHLFWQGDVHGQGLTADCYGSAVINSEGGAILAMVNEAQNLRETAAAYTAFAAGQAATKVALPLWRREHAFGLSTGISVMNVGAEEARVTLEVNESRGAGFTRIACGAPCERTVAPNRTAIFWPPAITAIPRGSYGSATIVSTQPVVAIVNDVVLSAAVDMSTYAGIGVNAPLTSAGLAVAMPYLLK